MKRAFLIFMSLIFASCLIVVYFLMPITFAHGGKTDSQGGHTDSSTGEYHYHHGYSAHQHEDLDGDGVLDCPYDFVDATDHSSDSITGNNNNSPTTYSAKDSDNHDTDTYSHTETKKVGEEVNQTTIKWLYFLLIVSLLAVLILAIRLFKYKAEIKYLKSEIEHIKNDCSKTLNYREKKYNDAMSYIFKQMTNKFGLSGDVLLLKLAGAPDDVFINEYGLPEKTGDPSYYIVYASGSINSYRHYDYLCFHLEKCRHAKIPINVYQIDRKIYKPCKVCKPLPTIPDWMDVHKKLKEITKNIEL